MVARQTSELPRSKSLPMATRAFSGPHPLQGEAHISLLKEEGTITPSLPPEPPSLSSSASAPPNSKRRTRSQSSGSKPRAKTKRTKGESSSEESRGGVGGEEGEKEWRMPVDAPNAEEENKHKGKKNEKKKLSKSFRGKETAEDEEGTPLQESKVERISTLHSYFSVTPRRQRDEQEESFRPSMAKSVCSFAAVISLDDEEEEEEEKEEAALDNGKEAEQERRRSEHVDPMEVLESQSVIVDEDDDVQIIDNEEELEHLREQSPRCSPTFFSSAKAKGKTSRSLQRETTSVSSSSQPSTPRWGALIDRGGSSSSAASKSMPPPSDSSLSFFSPTKTQNGSDTSLASSPSSSINSSAEDISVPWNQRAFHVHYINRFGYHPPGVGVYAQWWRGARASVFGGGPAPLRPSRPMQTAPINASGIEELDKENVEEQKESSPPEMHLNNLDIVLGFCLDNASCFFTEEDSQILGTIMSLEPIARAAVASLYHGSRHVVRVRKGQQKSWSLQNGEESEETQKCESEALRDGKVLNEQTIKAMRSAKLARLISKHNLRTCSGDLIWHLLYRSECRKLINLLQKDPHLKRSFLQEAQSSASSSSPSPPPAFEGETKGSEKDVRAWRRKQMADNSRDEFLVAWSLVLKVEVPKGSVKKFWVMLESFLCDSQLPASKGILPVKEEKGSFLSGEETQSQRGSFCVYLEDRVLKLLYHAHVAFMSCSGYSPEDTIAMLSVDMSRLMFPTPSKRDGENTRKVLKPQQTLFRNIYEFQNFLEALELSDKMEAAVASGNAAVAYRCLHRATDILHLLPSSSSSTASIREKATASGSGVRIPPREGSSGEDSSIRVATNAFGIMCTRMERVIHFGIHLLEREKKYSEAVHYLKMILSAPPPFCYSSHRAAYWLRLSTDYQHLQSPSKALETCEEALQDPWLSDCPDKLSLQDRQLRLSVPPLRWTKPKFPSLCQGTTVRVCQTEVNYVKPQSSWTGAGRGSGASDATSTGALGGTAEVYIGAVGVEGEGADIIDGGSVYSAATAENGYTDRSSTGKSVELAVLDWYLSSRLLAGASDRRLATTATAGDEAAAYGGCERTSGWKGMHAENGVFLTLFTLIAWDILYQDADAAFQTSYQEHPRDMFCGAEFMGKRKRHITLLLDSLNTIDNITTILIKKWQKHCGKAAMGCNWTRNTLEDLLAIAHGLGPAVVRTTCLHLMSSYSTYRHGFPDLIMWNTDPDRPRVVLVEVKGPGDRLSTGQRLWIHRLHQAGAEVEVCYVTPANQDKKKKP